MMKMLLGILGYKYIIDFDWKNIYEKAFEYGLVTDEAYKTKKDDNLNYTRGEAFDLIKNTLETQLKGSKRTLIQSWMDSERFTKEQVTQAGLDADVLKTEINNINVVNSTTIRVTFNEPIDNIDAEDITINQKDSDKTLNIQKVTVKDEVATISTSAQGELKGYTLVVGKVMDAEGFKVTDLAAEFKGYMPDEVVSDRFLISKIESVSKDTINVYFTQPISSVPTVPSFYQILEDDSSWVTGDSSNMYIAKLPDSDRGIIIRLKGRYFDIQKMYKLKISGNLTDKTGIKINDGSGDEKIFPPMVSDNLELERDMTYAFSKDIVTVEFNKPLDQSSVENGSTFQIVDSNGIPKADISRLDPNNAKRVLIGMAAPLDPNQKYKLNIFSLKDIERATTLDETHIEFEVADESRENLAIALVEAVSNSEIRVYFNKRIDRNSVSVTRFLLSSTSDSNFSNQPFDSYYYNEDDNPSMVALYLNPSSKKMKDVSYTLKVTDGLKDYLVQSNGDLTSDITGTSNDKQSPSMTSAMILGLRTIKLEFDKPISSNNTTTANYKIKRKNSDDQDVIITPNSVSVYDNRYVVLRLGEDLEPSRTYKIEYMLINDIRGDGFAGGSNKEDILTFAY